MKIAIGADHGGYKLKEALIKHLRKKRHAVKDFGAFSEESCDYPIIGYEVAKAVGRKKFQRGIVICKTGIGMSMVANKAKGARAALCDRIDIARSSREHNDANILVLAAKAVNEKEARKIVNAWLPVRCAGARHKRRVRQIEEIDRKK